MEERGGVPRQGHEERRVGHRDLPPGGDGNFYIIDQSMESRQVDPATAGAWTGLLDKDSCMIFEGDICELEFNCRTWNYDVPGTLG